MNQALHQIGRTVARVAGLGAGSVEVRRERLRLRHWPPALAGTRIAVLADLHTGSPQVDERRLGEIVELVNRERVDVVALVGDYIDPRVAFGEWVSPEAIAARLGGLEARAGRYAVLGNHDWAHAGERMPAALRDAGLPVLENEAVRTDAGFWVAGLGDYTKRTADVERALAQVPLDDPVVLLSHNPDVFPQVPDRVALTISGHTHGAQVDIPLVREKTTPSRFGARYAGGHVEEHGRHLYVSEGIGTSRFPVRFRARPSIGLLDLR